MTLGKVAKLMGGQLFGPADLAIYGPADIDATESGGIAFAESLSYVERGEKSLVSALILPPGLSSTKPHVCVSEPRRAFFQLVAQWHRPPALNEGVHPTAIVSPGATIHSQARIGAYAVIASGADVDAGASVFPFAYIGERCRVGKDCTIYPHAVLLVDVELGAGTIVHAGAVLAADGFGYIWDGRQQVKVPQVGRVVVGENAEIGALTAVDRATIGQTVIGEGVKLDNLVQIAHNVQIGAHTVVAAQSGIGGSAEVGERVALAGQVGVSDHVRIGDDVRLGARSAALQDIEEPGDYLGTPARPVAEAKRNLVLLTKLHEIARRLRKLEQTVEEKQR